MGAVTKFVDELRNTVRVTVWPIRHSNRSAGFQQLAAHLPSQARCGSCDESGASPEWLVNHEMSPC